MKYSLIITLIFTTTLLITVSSSVYAENDYSAEPYDKGQLQTAYFDSARNGNIELLKAFYQAGLNTGVVDKKGYSALILAAYNGQEKTVDYLLNEAGADACQEDNRGNTALMGALFKGNFSIVKKLIDAGCDLNKTNKNGQTALMFATLFDRQSSIEKLILAGADITLKDKAGNSLGDIAISQGNYHLTKKKSRIHKESTSSSPTNK